MTNRYEIIEAFTYAFTNFEEDVDDYEMSNRKIRNGFNEGSSFGRQCYEQARDRMEKIIGKDAHLKDQDAYIFGYADGLNYANHNGYIGSNPDNITKLRCELYEKGNKLGREHAQKAGEKSREIAVRELPGKTKKTKP